MFVENSFHIRFDLKSQIFKCQLQCTQCFRNIFPCAVLTYMPYFQDFSRQYVKTSRNHYSVPAAHLFEYVGIFQPFGNVEDRNGISSPVIEVKLKASRIQRFSRCGRYRLMTLENILLPVCCLLYAQRTARV